MYTVLPNKQRRLHDCAVCFASNFLASRNDLRLADATPSDIGRAFAENGLRGLALPRKFGGSGGGYLDLALAAQALTQYGGNPGIVLSWLLQEMIARTLVAEGSSVKQKARYLPQMGTGEITAALAVSEPDAGARRNRLVTRAERRGDKFFLSGEKTFVTNAPIADLFIVVAVTGNRNGKNELSAFLVPAATTGLTRTKPLSLPFLRPCPHGGILLTDCAVPTDALLGKQGRGYEDTAVRFRAFEDVLMMSLFAGTMSAQLDLVAADSSLQATDEIVCAQLGRLRILRDAAQSLSYSGAAMLKGSNVPAEALSLSIACRNLAEDFHTTLQQIVAAHPVKAEMSLSELTADLTGMLSIAKNIAALRQKKLGAELIKGAK